MHATDYQVVPSFEVEKIVILGINGKINLWTHGTLEICVEFSNFDASFRQVVVAMGCTIEESHILGNFSGFLNSALGMQTLCKPLSGTL